VHKPLLLLDVDGVLTRSPTRPTATPSTASSRRTTSRSVSARITPTGWGSWGPTSRSSGLPPGVRRRTSSSARRSVSRRSVSSRSHQARSSRGRRCRQLPRSSESGPPPGSTTSWPTRHGHGRGNVRLARWSWRRPRLPVWRVRSSSVWKRGP